MLSVIMQWSKLYVCTCTCTYMSQDGYTALYLAAQQGHEDVVELLIEAKADPQLKMKVTI